mmetsp:Transcript_34400/g.60286  ORF Transcript_34400/g.60286 Transcript_34400/m.60286 type:complete len:214 (-) Transcript_34400:1315-1956(-)
MDYVHKFNMKSQTILPLTASRLAPRPRISSLDQGSLASSSSPTISRSKGSLTPIIVKVCTPTPSSSRMTLSSKKKIDCKQFTFTDAAVKVKDSAVLDQGDFKKAIVDEEIEHAKHWDGQDSLTIELNSIMIPVPTRKRYVKCGKQPEEVKRRPLKRQRSLTQCHPGNELDQLQLIATRSEPGHMHNLKSTSSLREIIATRLSFAAPFVRAPQV